MHTYKKRHPQLTHLIELTECSKGN